MPRFTGRQYPGAMKDHRARKREEAEARQAEARSKAVDALNALAALGTAIAAPFIALADAFVAVGKAFAGTREHTQDDFALAPGEWKRGGYTGTPRYDLAGFLPVGMTVLPGDVNNWRTAEPERILSVEEWAEVHRLAKEKGADQ